MESAIQFNVILLGGLCIEESQVSMSTLNLCILETLKHLLWQTAKTQMKCSRMLHFIRVCIVCLDKKDLDGMKYIFIKKFYSDSFIHLRLIVSNQMEEFISILRVKMNCCWRLLSLQTVQTFVTCHTPHLVLVYLVSQGTLKSGLEVMKLFFLLNSTEHKISTALKK